MNKFIELCIVKESVFLPSYTWDDYMEQCDPKDIHVIYVKEPFYAYQFDKIKIEFDPSMAPSVKQVIGTFIIVDMGFNIPSLSSYDTYVNKKVITIYSKEDKKEKKSKNTKSMFDNIINKFKSQFIPEKEEGIKISMEGTICIPNKEGEYVGITKSNSLVSYPEEMCLDFPVYSIRKSFDEIKSGDIIKHEDSYLKIIKINNESSFSCLSYSGTTKTKKLTKDYLLGNKEYARVIINMFDSDLINKEGNISNFLPFILLENKEGRNDVKDILTMQMLRGNSQQINPMMCMAFLDKEEEKSSIWEKLIMMQMIQGNNGIFNLFNNAVKKETK